MSRLSFAVGIILYTLLFVIQIGLCVGLPILGFLALFKYVSGG